MSCSQCSDSYDLLAQFTQHNVCGKCAKKNQKSLLSSASLPCYVCGQLIDIEELDENAAYTYPDNRPYCPDHAQKDEEIGDPNPCADCGGFNGQHERASCYE